MLIFHSLISPQLKSQGPMSSHLVYTLHYYVNSFLRHTARMWNQLPYKVVSTAQDFLVTSQVLHQNVVVML